MKRKRRLMDWQEMSLNSSYQRGDTFREAAEKAGVSLNTVCHRFKEFSDGIIMSAQRKKALESRQRWY